MDDAEEDTRILRYWGEKPVAAYATAWVGDHCLRFGHQRDADGALKAHPGLRLRFGSMAHCDDDDVLDLLAVRGTPAECATRLRQEYGAVADRLSLTTHNASVEALGQMTTELRELR